MLACGSHLRYAGVCGGRCTACTSLIRRYRPQERTGHAEHFDLTALATVVVSLSTAGADYPAGGGLYVSTGAQVKVVGLDAGDAVRCATHLRHSALP
jgi:hypothetical protein